jgi:multidrug efflux pump subunit AcrA (membrane-fusion protein)
MIGQVKLSVPRIVAAVIVPESAVIDGAEGAQVALLDAASRVAYRRVELGRNLGGDIEILDGVAVGDQVVVAPNALLRAGMRVAVRRSPPPAQG